MDYRHFEKQTWEITRLKSRSATEALYEYRWTYQGKGTSVNWPWSATWDMSSQQNSVSGSVRKYKMRSKWPMPTRMCCISPMTSPKQIWKTEKRA